jgi:hypothetical protein
MEVDALSKYEVWGRKEIGKGRRQRLAFGLSSEADARSARTELMAKGFQDTVVVQRPPQYGRIGGLQNQGRQKKNPI